jgi:S1-C subfamily serine protease
VILENWRNAILGLGIGGKAIELVKDLNSALDSHKSGDKVKLTIIRDEKRQEIQVML